MDLASSDAAHDDALNKLAIASLGPSPEPPTLRDFNLPEGRFPFFSRTIFVNFFYDGEDSYAQRDKYFESNSGPNITAH